MTAPDAAAVPLRARLLLARLGPAACGAVLLCVLGLAAWVWAWQQRAALERFEARASAAATTSTPAARPSAPPVAEAAAAADSGRNLALFYDNLGPRRYAEQEVKTLFALAAKSGLSLNQGEYKFSYDQASRVHSYQVLLPVKGSYRAIWQFVLALLRAVPFAALDEISFKRELIADPVAEAHLRLTFYLKDGAGMARP